MDIEKDAIKLHYISGFQDLASFISSDIDGDATIFRRFETLSARNLLYLQSEMAELEALQARYDKEDAEEASKEGSGWSTIRSCGKDWNAFEREANSPTPSTRDHFKKRMELVLTIRSKLKEYREALLMESAILSLRRPSRQAHDAFIRTFWNERDGQRIEPALIGRSENLYDQREELLTLKRGHEDRLTYFLRRYCSRLFRIRRYDSSSSNVEYFSARRISTAVNVITVLLAAALLFGAIYNLYYVRRNQIKLGLIAVYTLAFALSISLISNARRAEVFGACAAYAAVLVVFVSGNLGSTNDPG
ncbi:hypothetical protein LTR72_009526 [Exophiala xenobiotica]|nr:hypothetical protein LTR72_009526 [Exophiala xenobiotica]KAK5287850.1 hypothetical protein LTR14_008633 [Exophiala xenobiotica]KAK5476020.1 hypothetical protein LTR55_008895 [Exophiala xenobiotica]